MTGRNLLKYSNGWGHLIMSLAVLAVGVWLILAGYAPYGISMIGLVTTAWFVPGAAKQVAHEVSEQVTTAPLPSLGEEKVNNVSNTHS